MKKHDLQEYLYANIPLSKAVGIKVLALSSEGVTLTAPLAPNVNHKGTVFAGSVSSVALLSAWSLLFVSLKNEGIKGQGVVQRNTITYEQPVTGTFTAFAAAPHPDAWQKFVSTLKRRKRARIRLESILTCNGLRVARLEGEFVAIAGPDS
jgi:thioesterase domain-containing protein